MDNLKNFVVSKGLEVADSINTGYIILNGKAVSGLVDSSNVLGLIDSAYISSKSSGVDSSATIALIDSSYVQARESISISSFNTIAVAGQTDIVADSIGLSWRTSTEQAKLISSDFATNDGFARFVDLAGDYAIVSASSYDESPYENNGAAFIFKRTDSAGGTGWAQQAKLVRDSSSHSQSFSWSVSLNESATSALISNGGSSYAITEYTRDSANSTTWAQGQKILPAAGVTPTNTADWARNGAFDRKGNYFVVGADNDYGNGSSSTRYGSAWVYNKNSSGSQWALQQELVPSDDSDGAGTKGYGYAVSIATDSLIVVGADRYYNYTGAVYIFERDGSTWTQTQRLVGQASASSYFGKNVSMHGDYLAVSAPHMTSNTGIVYIYKNLGGTWTFQTSVQASDASTGKYFGNGLTLKGSQLLVSAYAANTVYVFQRYGETWVEIKKIVGSSLSDGNMSGQIGGANPGNLRINKSATDTDFLIGSVNKGAYVFTVPLATGPSNTLTLAAGDGITLATDPSTETVTVAAKDPLATFHTLAIDGQPDITTDLRTIADYESISNQQVIIPPNGSTDDYFGEGVAIDNGYAIINAKWSDSDTTNAGACYIYTRSGTTWSHQQTITSPIDPPVTNNFGSGVVDIKGSRVVIGAEYDDSNGTNAGAIYTFTRSGTTWTEEQRIVSSDIAAGDFFGSSVSMQGKYIAVGAYAKDDSAGAADQGSAYIFKATSTTTLENAAYDNVQSLSLATSGNTTLSNPKTMLFNSDGTKVYVYDVTKDIICQYSLSAPYDITSDFRTLWAGKPGNAEYSVTIAGQSDMTIKAMRWNDDGTKIFVLCDINDKIYQHNLTTAYDISTASYSNNSFSTSSQETQPKGFTFNNDGTSMYICGVQENKIFQYTLSTAYDLSTVSYANKSFTTNSGSHGSPIAIQFDETGKKLFILGSSSGGGIRQHNLATAFDVSSSITVSSYSLNIFTIATQANDFTFNADMSKLYSVDDGANKIMQYSTSGAGAEWAQQAKLTPSDVGKAGDKFGWDIKLNTAATTAIVSAKDHDTGGVRTGQTYVFTRSGTTWSQQAMLQPAGLGSNNYSGNAISISSSGNYIGICVQNQDNPDGYVGVVYVFKKVGSTWVEHAKLYPNDTNSNSRFASSIVIDDDFLAVGDYGGNITGVTNIGVVYFWKRSGETWTQINKINAFDTSYGSYGGLSFGNLNSLDIDGNDILVGAYKAPGSTGPGRAYVFTATNKQTLSDTLTLEAGSGISITTNATTDTVTIAGSAAGLDSAGVTSLIDSAYVQTRQTKYTNADFTDSAYVTTQINSVIDAAPGALDTLNELAAALGDDANFSTTITNQIAGKLDSAATTSLIDSAYVQARAPAGGNDSATTIALVDSSYVQARQITPISAFNTITVATQNNVVADSAAISYENTAQQAILQASNRGANDNFGSRVAIDNGYAIVTASSEDTGGSEAGSCYVYVRSGTTWTQQQQITSPISPPDGHYFGTDVDMEGSRVVIGSKYDDTDYNHGGGVHVYTRSGTTWSLEQRLASTDIAANDWFGDRVAISGNYIVASAHKKNSSEGAVYVFKGATSTTLNGSSYDSVQSVSLNAIESQPKSMLFNSDGTKVFIVGMSADAIKEYSLATPYDISTNFLSNASSSYSLTISGENNMGVYAMRWNSDGTKVYVLCNNNMKIYQHNLTTAYDISTASYSNKNFSSTTQENAYTGFTFNNDGTSMYLCGSQNSKVFQYTLSTAYDISTASYASKSFTPQGSHGGTIGIQFDESGKKLFILGNSLRQHDLATAFDVSSSITVSYAINILTNATQAGDFTFNADMSKLYAVEPSTDKIFQFSTSGALTVWAQQAKLLASDNTTGDKFGFDVDIDGDTIAIGAAVADTGGKVYAFTRSGTTWSQQAAFTSSDISSEDEFGGSVSISGDTILVGAYKVDGSGDVPHGAAYAFTRSGTTWSQQAKIQPDDVGNDYGGTTAFAYRNVSLEGDVALVGWNRATFDGTAQTGAAYIFKRSGTTWTQLKKIGASDATAADGFGGSTAIDGRDIIIGASGENGGRGQAYTFVVPDAALYSDTLTLAGGSGITLTTNASTDTVTITGSAAGLDSAGATALIDSSYIQARAPAGGNDSATTIALIDSSYVQARALASASVTSSATAPSSPSSGDMWFDTTDTSLLVYYADSDGAQWVDISGATGATGPAGPSGSPEIIKIDSDLTTTDSDQVIHSFSKSTYRTIKYTAQLENDDSSGYHAEELLLTHNGTNVAITSYAKLALDSDLGIFDAAINGSNVELRLTPTKVNTHVKLRAITITEGNATPNDINALLIPIDSDLTTTDSDQVIHSFSKSTYRTMKYVAQLKHASSNAYHSQEILLVHNGTFVAMTGYAKLFLDSDLGTFDAAINGSNVELRLTPAKTNTNVKLRAIRTTV